MNEKIYCTSIDYATTITDCKFETPIIATLEKDNKRIVAYDIAGLRINVTKEFENKTQKTYLHITGKDKILNIEKEFNEKIFIDTDIYNKYNFYVDKGILYVELYEKINKAPEFNRVEKKKEEVTSSGNN